MERINHEQLEVGSATTLLPLVAMFSVINLLLAPLLECEMLKGWPVVTHRGSKCNLDEKDKGQRE